MPCEVVKTEERQESTCSEICAWIFVLKAHVPPSFCFQKIVCTLLLFISQDQIEEVSHHGLMTLVLCTVRMVKFAHEILAATHLPMKNTLLLKSFEWIWDLPLDVSVCASLVDCSNSKAYQTHYSARFQTIKVGLRRVDAGFRSLLELVSQCD